MNGWLIFVRVASAIIVGVVLAVLFRYETTPTGPGAAYKQDRWTGDTYFMYGAVERKVKPQAYERPAP